MEEKHHKEAARQGTAGGGELSHIGPAVRRGKAYQNYRRTEQHLVGRERQGEADREAGREAVQGSNLLGCPDRE